MKTFTAFNFVSWDYQISSSHLNEVHLF